MLGRLIEGKIVQQDRAEDGALGFNIGRHAMRETVIGSCQRDRQPGKGDLMLAAKVLWMRGTALENQMEIENFWVVKLHGELFASMSASHRTRSNMQEYRRTNCESQDLGRKNKYGPGQPPEPYRLRSTSFACFRRRSCESAYGNQVVSGEMLVFSVYLARIRDPLSYFG
jgi:hypothetical protein